MLASGLSVEVVGNDLLATVIALVWLVGITNAFNLLDNMDGLAATLAAVACAYFALDAVALSTRTETCSRSRFARLCLRSRFLPFNLRRGRPRPSSWATPAAR